MATRKRGLGKGLSSLISQPAVPVEHEPTETEGQAPEETEQTNDASGEAGERSEVSGAGLRYVAIDQIVPGQFQPRQVMQEDALEELAASIRSKGVIEPVVLRPVSARQYELIAGERRWRAARLAGLAEVPAVVREVSDEDAIAMALIENIQREDLSPMEEAGALKRLQQEFSMTQQEIAEMVGKNRATVANLLRLHNLEPDVRKLLEDGDLEMGHARALLALEGRTQSRIAADVARKSLTVRATEAMVRKALDGDAGKSAGSDKDPEVDANISRLEETLANRLGAKVAIKHSNKGKGSLVIQYNTLDELDGILGHIR